MLRKPNLAIPNRRVAVGDAERHRHVGRLKTTLVRKQAKLGRSHGLLDTCMLGAPCSGGWWADVLSVPDRATLRGFLGWGNVPTLGLCLDAAKKAFPGRHPRR
jgi:hypothetical protein